MEWEVGRRKRRKRTLICADHSLRLLTRTSHPVPLRNQPSSTTNGVKQVLTPRRFFASTSQPRSPISGILVESVKRMCVCGLKQACEMRRGGGEEEVKEIDKDSCMEARNVHIQNKYQGQMRSWIRLGKPLSGEGFR
jgi:hypothetical protein